jgi:BON domain
MNLRNMYRSMFAILFAVGLLLGCSRSRSDAQIASEIQSKINSDSNIPTKQVTVGASNSVVTLSGAVATEYGRTAAENDASQVEGVKTVRNDLQVASAVVSAPAHVSAPSRQRTRSGSSAVIRPSAAVLVTIPAGTPFSVRLVDSIDSNKNKDGDTFHATLDSPIVVGGRVVVPQDADVDGEIRGLKSAGHFTGRSEIALVLTKLSFNGKSYDIETNEYKKEGASRGKRTAETIGGGAAIGALIGGLTGGGKGAAIGAGVGAGAGTGVQALTKGQQIQIPSETMLEFQLNAPLTVEPSATSRNAGRARVE